MKAYIAGPISGVPDYKARFFVVEQYLSAYGIIAVNPAVLPYGLTHEEYMRICKAMIDVCDMVVMLDGWTRSKGAREEYDYAFFSNKRLVSFNEIVFTEQQSKEMFYKWLLKK